MLFNYKDFVDAKIHNNYMGFKLNIFFKAFQIVNNNGKATQIFVLATPMELTELGLADLDMN